MADGNVGSLFMTLGIKDEISAALKTIENKLKGTNEAAEKINASLQKQVETVNKSNFGEVFNKAIAHIKEYNEDLLKSNKILLSMQGIRFDAKNMFGDLTKVSSYLTTLDAEIRKIGKNPTKTDQDFLDTWKDKIRNALQYIKILQDIQSEQNKIDKKVGLNPNVDTATAMKAKKMFSDIREQLMTVFQNGGIDDAKVMSSFGKLMAMARKASTDMMDAFGKQNPLSSYENWTARLEAEFDKLRAKAFDLRRAIELDGGKNDTRELEARVKRLGELGNMVTRALNNPDVLKDSVQVRNLISDISVEMVRATAASNMYNNERRITETIERQYAKEVAATNKEHEKKLQAIDREGKAIQRNAEIQQKLADRQQKALENRKKIDNSETAYYARIRDILAQIDSLNKSISAPVMNASRLGMALPQSIGEDLRKLYSIKQTLEANMTAGRNMGLGWLKDFLNRNGFSEITKELKKFTGNIDEARDKYQRLFDILNRLRVERSRANVLGLDTQKLDNDIAHVLDKLHVLRGIVQTGIGNVGDITGIDNRALRNIEKDVQSQKRLNNEKERSNKLERKHQEELNKTGRQIQSSLVKGFKDANNAAGRLNSTVQDLKSLFLQGGLVFGAQQFAMNIIRTGGEMEKQHIAMQSILGDMQNANTMFNQTKELALQSPFTFSELNRDVKQLAAYGVEYENLYDTTKRLADMASGLGVSFERIALAFGQVQARGWLDGKELRQIAYAGIPLLDRLSKYYSQREGKKVTTSDVKGRITNREVSFQDVKNIFWEMTDAGGQFYNMQLTLSETLLGRYNKLKDAWEIMLADFARGDSVIGGTFKWVLDLVTSLVQQMHTLGPVMTAAFAGFAIKKGITAFGSGGAANFLSNKANIANNIQAQLAQGKQISQIERQILLTKNQITNADLRSLIAYQNISKQELRRLYLSGAITTQQYKTSLALMKHVALTNAATASTNNYALSWRKVGVAGMLALNGIGNAIKGLWAAIGGLPGLIVTAATMGIMTLVSKYQDLTQKIKQTQDEILDRRKQVADFTSQNNVAKALASGDNKEIGNLIESYKEKLKELAPYDYSNLLMKADEKKSHEERLKYLEQELKLIDKANKANAGRFVDNGTWYEDLLGITGKGRSSYSEFMSVINDINKSASSYLLSQAKANAFGATSADKTMFNLNKNGFLNYAQKVKDYIAKEFGDISKDENLRRQAIQAMNNIFSAMGVSAENANLIRTAVLQAFGIGNDGWLSGEVGKRMSDLISERFPEIALKIKSDQSLNEGEKKKVKELMNDAKSELVNQYPIFSTTLQNLLDQSNFTAVVHLVTQSYGGVFNNLQKELAARIPQLQEGIQSDMFSLYSSKAETWGKENSWYAARNKAKEEIDKARNEYESAKKSNASDVNDKYTEYDRLKRVALDLLNYDYEGELKKSNKEPKGGKEDEQLKRLRKRIELYKKFYSEYKKLQDLVGNGALDKLRKDGEFEPVFKYGLNNITDYESSVRQLLGAVPANTADRKDYRDQAIADIQTKNRELFSEQIAKDNEELSTQLGIISEQYEVYKKIVKLTGDNKGAMSIVFSGGMSTKSYSEYLKSQIAKVLPAHNLSARQNYTLDDVLGMSQSQFNSSYGKNNSRLSVLFKAYKDEQNKIKTETINMIADVIEKNRTLEQQLEDINTEYEYQLGLLQAQQDLTPDMRKRAEEGLKKTRDEKTASVQFEIFKRNSDWVTIFDDLDRVSTNTINSMIDKIDTFSKTTGLSVEVVKQLRDALDKLRKESMDRNPFDALFNATSRGNAIGNVIKNNEYVFSRGKKAYIDAATAKRTGLKEGEYSKSELENEQTSAYEDFPNAIKAIENKFKALGDVLNPVLDLFDALGMEDIPLAQGMGLATNALGAASSVAGGLNALGLSSLGPYGAAIGAGLSIVSGVFAMHDKALQKEIEASERRQKEMENLTKNLKSAIETTLGGIYNYRASVEATRNLQNIIKSFTDEYIPIFMSETPYSKETYQQALKAQKSGNAYDIELASLMAQRDEIAKQRDAEQRKKKSDEDAIQNYDQQIAEMEQSIDDFAQTFLKDIYSIDIKSWASQLTDAIVEAWAKGENAADAYHDKAQELMKGLTKNILSQKIMEIALKPTLGKLEDALKSKGRLDETDIPRITKELIEAGNNAVGNITNLLDALKEQGVDLSENGTLSVSNSIKSITEDTADLLASYLNAIRLDVSVNRENIRMILLAVQTMPELNNIARSQLTQLTTLVTLAEARNGKLDDMYSWMTKVTNGTLKLNVK